jgi:hypothetical protein
MTLPYRKQLEHALHLRQKRYPQMCYFLILTSYVSRDRVVSIATGYGLDDRGVGVRVPVGSRIFSSRRPDRFWGPPNHLPNGYRGSFAEGKATLAWR